MSGSTWLRRNVAGKLPVAVKLGVPVVGISIFAVVLLGAVGLRQTKARIDESYSFQSQGMTHLIETQYRLHPDDIPEMNSFLKGLVADHPSLMAVQLYRQGFGGPAYIWSSSTPSENTEPISSNVLVPSGKTVQQPDTYMNRPAFFDVESTRLPNGVASAGFLFNAQDRSAAISREARGIGIDAAAVIVAEILALVITLYVLVLIRLKRLGKAASAVAGGDLSVRLREGNDPPARDELTSVAREFDHMIKSVDARTRQQAAIAELGRHALAATELPELFTDAAYVVVECVGTEFSEVYELAEDGSELILRAGAGWSRGAVGSVRVANSPDSQAGYTLSAGGPVISSDVAGDTRFAASQLLLDHNVVSGMSVVIRGRDRKFGVLAAHSSSRREFSKEDINLLQSVANILAASIERNRAFERERRDAERLRELDEAKSTLLHAVSHDLRGPITSILGSASTLERADEMGLSNEDRNALLAGLSSSALKMNRMVADLLDLERLDRGVLDPKRSQTDIATLVQRVLSELDVPSYRQIELETEHVEIAIDEPKVERIVDNLIANALKHTSREARIWVRARSETGGAQIDVEDDGPGVPREMREAIFEPFKQGSGDGQSTPGVGIGLSLVAKFAELHGGRAWVTERSGGGAAFHVYLADGPIDISDAQTPTVRIPSDRGGRSSIG